MPEPAAPPITELLLAWNQGDARALERLAPLVYVELRRLAHRKMRGERAGHLLQTTALVNETYLRLVDCHLVKWRNRVQFFALSARLMRRILVDDARARDARKRGGACAQVSTDLPYPPVSLPRGIDVLALDEALSRLASVNPRQGQVVELRYFGGMTVHEVADALNVSVQTVMRDWNFAKLWLLRALRAGAQEPQG